MVDITARDRLKLLGGAGALLLPGCGGSSSTATPPPVAQTPPVVETPPAPTPETPVAPDAEDGSFGDGKLRNTFSNNFNFGTALTNNIIGANDLSAQIAQQQFNSITPEYEMKADQIAPNEGTYNFDPADRIVDWALENNMDVRGHALLWHEATPEYFYQGSRDDIRARLENYIMTVVDHFKDRVKIWDVVNEATSVDIFNGDNGIGPDRHTSWYEAVGNADYIDWAFLAARAADPDAVLFLSDYETENPLKRGWMIDIVRRLRSRGVPIDGVGHQFHLQLNTDPNEALAAIDAVDNEFAGLINHVTELDVSFYSDPGTCWEREFNCQADVGEIAPADLLATQATLLRSIFEGLVQRPSVENVSVWGVRDGDSWLNNAPTQRFNHPLLFNRDGDPKPAVLAITDPDYEI